MSSFFVSEFAEQICAHAHFRINTAAKNNYEPFDAADNFDKKKI